MQPVSSGTPLAISIAGLAVANQNIQIQTCFFAHFLVSVPQALEGEKKIMAAGWRGSDFRGCGMVRSAATLLTVGRSRLNETLTRRE